MPDFSTRSAEIEIMDDLAAAGPVIEVTLKELDTINRLLGGNNVTIDGIKKLLPDHRKNLVIVDVGCGSGDILRIIRRRIRNAKDAKLIGIDANPNIVAYAKAHTSDNGIEFRAIDIFSPEFRNLEFDILTGTLFFHHFTDYQLAEFLGWASSRARIGVVINDIHRHWFAYHSIKLLTAAFSRSEMVRHDAAVSVMRAFKKEELIAILTKAGIRNYEIKWMWAFRWQLIIRPN
jgi:2-polyprenyl-3-methyl-5-hydroxy-6-metoxy-1,4-benzoquinol methylase